MGEHFLGEEIVDDEIAWDLGDCEIAGWDLDDFALERQQGSGGDSPGALISYCKLATERKESYYDCNFHATRVCAGGGGARPARRPGPFRLTPVRCGRGDGFVPIWAARVVSIQSFSGIS